MGLFCSSAFDRSLAPRGNASGDAPRHLAQVPDFSLTAGRGASRAAFPRRAWERSKSFQFQRFKFQ
ncbi:DUF1534 domain-containing protein [Pseudomonas orientalis]|uniref:DUF1534 domain-containing protein n=1 Tax=Pseudomonas orientalis TaxID=76758 RepID=A0A4Q7D708_9PSED|nr:DUF1534 domain-containing protein [Pseudomonas orientalis]